MANFFLCRIYSTGDASETEIDTVLLLTAEGYLVAEYDSDLDKVVRFEKVCNFTCKSNGGLWAFKFSINMTILNTGPTSKCYRDRTWMVPAFQNIPNNAYTTTVSTHQLFYRQWGSILPHAAVSVIEIL